MNGARNIEEGVKLNYKPVSINVKLGNVKKCASGILIFQEFELSDGIILKKSNHKVLEVHRCQAANYNTTISYTYFLEDIKLIEAQKVGNFHLFAN